MLKNYIKLAWRNIVKRRFFSFINVIGLAAGLTFTLLTATYIYEDLHVNRQLPNADNQYIIQSKWKDPNMGLELTTIAELPKALKENYPNLVSNYYRFDGVTSTVSKNNTHFREGIQIGDSTLLHMYGFKLQQGNAATALKGVFSVVITEPIARKYFGRTNVLGETLTIDNFSGGKHDFTITGVLQPQTKNSVLQLADQSHNDILMPEAAAAYMKRSITGWDNFVVGYVELHKGVTPAHLQQAIQQLMKSHAPAQVAQNMQPYFIPLKSYYLQANNGTISKMVYTLSAIAFFILLMAVINFINLSVSQSTSRLKEMGIRKVLGGLKRQLMAQFLTESVLLVLISTVIAMGLFIISTPYFRDVIGEPALSLAHLPAWFWITPFLLAVVIGLVAGSYPAFVLASLKSVDSLKGKLTTIGENIWLRKSLVAFQFSTAALVFIAAIVISKQVNLFFNTNLGFTRDYVIYAPVPRDWSDAGVQKMELVRNELAQMPQVSNATLSWEIPDGRNVGPVQVYKQGADSTQSISAQLLYADNQYAATYQIAVKAGQLFEPVYKPADANKVVVNETAAHALGWPDAATAINQQVRLPGIPGMYTIGGVTADFHFDSMQQRIQPMVFMNTHATQYYRYLSVKIKPGNMTQNIQALERKWGMLLPGAPFEYNFVDNALQNVYQTEIRLQKASYLATALAVIIVFLGVLAMTAWSVQKRTREIGIRKVLGSSVAGIMSLFMKEFLGIVLVAGIVTCPVAYYLMHNWLNDYAYKINLNATPFLHALTALSAATALLIALQTLKTATATPVKSLRND